MEHISVLLRETIDSLNVQEDGIYIDGTLGRGGHSKEVLKRLKTGHLYAFDKDAKAIEESTENLKEYLEKITIIHNDFSKMKIEMSSRGIKGVDGIMLDLGVSSPQFDDPERGFSYRYDAKLDMRMNREQSLSAYDVINEYDFEKLCNIFWLYGEEKNAKQIARMIEKNRIKKPIETTFELVDVIKSALPNKILNKKGHPAKQVFQALRIEVNDELNILKETLHMATDLLNLHGRLAVITFHSLEDRIVKQMFKELSSPSFVDARIPVKAVDLETANFELVYKKPIVSSEEELQNNHRAHSAKLRVIERVKY